MGSSIHERTFTGSDAAAGPPGRGVWEVSVPSVKSPRLARSTLAWTSEESNARTFLPSGAEGVDAGAAELPDPAAADGAEGFETDEGTPLGPPRCAALNEARMSALEKDFTSPLKSSACRSVEPRVPCGSRASAIFYTVLSSNAL